MSAQTSDEFMTAQVFAEEMGVHYRTALSWLRNGLVPGAIERETPMGNYWQIPRDALQMEKPKPGPKPKSAKKSAKKKGAQKK
jgi:hypothetical protein